MRVKICGLMRREDVEAADGLGADYVGVILSGGFARSVDPALAPELVRGVAASPVAVFVNETPEVAAARARALGARVVQLHGDESPRVVEQTGRLGDWRLWKSIRIAEPHDVSAAVRRYGGLVQGLLIEGSRPGVYGGGGVRLDLDHLARVRSEIPAHLEVVLAGGLTPETVGDAVARFRPAVVDVSSGVERERGRKDPDLLRLFFQAVRRPTLPG